MSKPTPILPAALLMVAGAAALAAVGHAAPREQVIDQANIVVTLYSDQVVYRTLPAELVTAELYDADGPKATGLGFSDADGWSHVQFVAMMGARDTVVRPGDRIALVRLQHRPVFVDVPDFRAELDVDADRVLGTAPAGVELSVQLVIGGHGEPTQTVDRSVTAGPDGTFQLDLAPDVDLPAAQTTATVWFQSAGVRYVAQVAAFGADVVLDAGQVTGSATPGDKIAVEVRHADGSVLAPAPQEVTSGPAWSVSLGNQYAPGPNDYVRAGDRVTVTVDSGGAVRTFPMDALEVQLTVEPSSSRVRGTAPASLAVEVLASSLAGGAAYGRTVAGDDGSFQVDLGGTRLGPGWRVRAAYPVDPEVTVGRVAVIPQVLAGVGTTTVHGLARPGTDVTVTLLSDAGHVKYEGQAWVGDQGDFAASLADFLSGSEVPIEAGDVMEVSFVSGDPVAAQVPALTAVADDAADSVSGTTTPGTAVRVTVESDSGAPAFTATVGASGQYDVAMPGYDLRRPSDGLVTTDLDQPIAFYTPWAATRLDVQLSGDYATVTANGPPGREWEATLTAPDGTELASASGRTLDLTAYGPNMVVFGPERGLFTLDLTDATGEPIPVRTGDHLEVRAGDQRVALTVPPLTAEVFVGDDVVTGQTLPGATVHMEVAALGAEPALADVQADDQGAFSYRFGPAYDITYNDALQVRLDLDGNLVARGVAAPGLTVDLDTGEVQGYVAWTSATEVSLVRGGRTIFQGTLLPGPSGELWASLVDAHGVALDMEAGDVVRVEPVDQSSAAVEVTLPELDIEADAHTDQISGRATPGGTLALLLTEVETRIGDTLGLGQAWPDISDDGTWVANPIPRTDVRPGTVVRAQYRTPSGHIVLRSRYVPLANVEQGAPNVCGAAQPGATAGSTLRDAGGTVLGTGTATVPWGGVFRTVLRDAAGALVATRSGDDAALDVDGKAVADVPLLPFDLVPDWTSGTLTGHAPPNRMITLVAPPSRCGTVEAQNAGAMLASIGMSDASGSVGLYVPGTLMPGSGVEISYDTDEDQRVFEVFTRAQGRIYVDTDRIAGLTNSAVPVTVTVRSASGTVLAGAQALSDEDGRFDARVTDAAGAALVVRPGQVVDISGGGDQATIPVEDLSFDWSPGEPVTGHAPTGLQLTLSLRLRTGQVLRVPLDVAADGTFHYGPPEVPPRAAWSWSDVEALRVELLTATGHLIISQTDDFETPSAAPSTIFLPFAGTGRPAAATSVAARKGEPGAATGFSSGSAHRPAEDAAVGAQAAERLQRLMWVEPPGS